MTSDLRDREGSVVSLSLPKFPVAGAEPQQGLPKGTETTEVTTTTSRHICRRGDGEGGRKKGREKERGEETGRDREGGGGMEKDTVVLPFLLPSILLPPPSIGP